MNYGQDLEKRVEGIPASEKPWGKGREVGISVEMPGGRNFCPSEVSSRREKLNGCV